MTRVEAVSRAIYEARMQQVGIPGFQIVPWDKLPHYSRLAALEVGKAALEAADAIHGPSRDQLMGRRA